MVGGEKGDKCERFIGRLHHHSSITGIVCGENDEMVVTEKHLAPVRNWGNIDS